MIQSHRDLGRLGDFEGWCLKGFDESGWFVSLMAARQQIPGFGTGTSPKLLNLVFKTQYGDEQPVLSGHGQFIALFLMATLGAEVRHLSISC